MNLRKGAWIGFTVGLLGSFSLMQTGYAEGVSRGALLASMCNTCHGKDGAGAAPMPALAGIPVADFVDIMQVLASGEQPNTIMSRHAQGYTEEELRAMAEYFNNR